MSLAVKTLTQSGLFGLYCLNVLPERGLYWSYLASGSSCGASKGPQAELGEVATAMKTRQRCHFLLLCGSEVAAAFTCLQRSPGCCACLTAVITAGCSELQSPAHRRREHWRALGVGQGLDLWSEKVSPASKVSPRSGKAPVAERQETATPEPACAYLL